MATRLQDESDDDRLVRFAIADLNRARSHAQTLHGLANLIFVLGVCMTFASYAAAASSTDNVGLAAFAAAWTLLFFTVAWAVLKAIALHLHLTVDRAMLDGVD